MKRLIVIILAILSVILIYTKVFATEIKIPTSAIRVRVIPNSNSLLDQTMKKKVKEYLETNVYDLLENVDNIEDARKIISSNLDNINKDIEKIFKDNNYDMYYKVDFGYNYFPSKTYKTIKYEEGYYESLVVYIGEYKGDNWWCVLFPPLCLLDETNIEEKEYTFLVKEIINKFLSK